MLRTNMARLVGEGEPPPDKYVMEYQVEHERGFLMFGATRFSANALLPLDPRHFTTRSNVPLGSNLMDLEVPDDSWVWMWSRWYVDMTTNVDDQGWQYSWRFRSKNWSPQHRFGRSFVRQRQWMRPRVKRSLIDGQDEETAPLTKEETEHEQQAGRKLIDYFKSFRNDRETVDAIITYLIEHPAELPQLVYLKEEIEALLVFDISRESLHDKLAESNSDVCQQFLLAPSSGWRDQVLLHGQPGEEIMDHEEDDQRNETNEEIE